MPETSRGAVTVTDAPIPLLRVGPAHLSWWLRGHVLAAVLLALVVIGGTAGYVIIEGWSAWDAFYMTMITVSTVGYEEVRDLSFGGRLFTVVLVASGVGTALYFFSLLTADIVEGTLAARWEARVYERMLHDLDDHFIVCGYGRIGRVIVEELRRHDTACVVVEREHECVREAMEDGVLAIEADASQEDVLGTAGIERARGLVAALGSDVQNVYAVLGARMLRPDLFIIARAENDDSSRKMLRAGANRVISPNRIGAVHMAQTALRPAVVDFVQVATSSENLDLMMEQVLVSTGSTIAGRSLQDADVRKRFGVVVVAIQHHDDSMDFNPDPTAMLEAGDRLVVLGPRESLRSLEAAAS